MSPSPPPSETPTASVAFVDSNGSIGGYKTEWNPYVGLGAAIFGVCLISCGVYGRYRYKKRQKVELEEDNRAGREEEDAEGDRPRDIRMAEDRHGIDLEAPKGVGAGAGVGDLMAIHRTTDIILSTADDEADDEPAPLHASIKPVSRVKPRGEDPLRPAVIVTDGRSRFVISLHYTTLHYT